MPTPALRRALVAAIALLAPTWPGGARAQPFFATPPAPPHEPMFVSIYSVLPNDRGNDNMARIAAGHFTAAGPYYNADGKPTGVGAEYYARVNEAAAHGLGYIAHMPMHPAVIDDVAGEVRPNSMKAIPEAAVRAHVRAIADYTLNNAQANATVRGWFILPEELRPWKGGEMDYLRIVADELHRYDSLRRPVTMYNPNHRQPAELTTAVSQGLDWTLMGVYGFNVAINSRGARMAEGLGRILASAGATGSQPVAAFQLSEDFPAADLDALAAAIGGASHDDAIRQIIRHDVYQGLVRGIRGVQIWSGCDCRPNLTTYNEQLDAYVSVSNDLNGELGLSDVFLHGERRTDLHATVVAGPATVTYQNHVVDALAFADIAFDGARYVFVVNGANALVTARITGLPTGDAHITQLVAPAPELTVDGSAGSLLAALKPFEVLALRIDGVWNADANDDGRTNGVDFVAWQRNVGRSGVAGPAEGDFNHDGQVNVADLAVWSACRSDAAPAEPLPEPAAASLAIAAIFLGSLKGRQNAQKAQKS